MPTEHPWDALRSVPLSGRKVLAVAGSGDIPVFLSAHDPVSLTAVDVSVTACHLTELKRAAYRRFSRSEFYRFFFHGLPWLGFLGRDVDLTASLRDSRRSVLYDALRADLSVGARRFFDERITPHREETNPFSDFLRPTDALHLEWLPALRSNDAYCLWARGAQRDFSIEPRSLEDFLSSTEQDFHLVYASNVLEYVRMDYAMHSGLRAFRTFMESFWESMDRVLTAGGHAVFYVCQGQGTKTFRDILKELAPPCAMRYKENLVPVTVRPSAIAALVWRHVVVFFQKLRSGGRGAS